MTALQNAPESLREDALRDTEELLLGEMQSMELRDDESPEFLFAQLLRRCGTPEETAAGYMETFSGDIAKAPIPYSCRPGIRMPLLKFAACLPLLIGLTGGIAFAMLREPSKKSPFTQVQFDGDAVTVRFDEATYRWLSIDDIPVKKIVAAAKKEFGDRWQKRIAEDLVEVLWTMDHRPGDTVKLQLQNPKDNTEITVEKAAMTNENRQKIWRDRYRQEQQGLLKANQEDQVGASRQPPKKSPFTDVDFEDDKVTVQFESKTYRWLSIDDIPVEKIVAAAKKEFGDRWQKRIAEDLVEVLWTMDHRPGDTVKLQLHDPKNNAEVTIEKAAMTKKNRQKIWWDRFTQERQLKQEA